MIEKLNKLWTFETQESMSIDFGLIENQKKKKKIK